MGRPKARDPWHEVKVQLDFSYHLGRELRSFKSGASIKYSILLVILQVFRQKPIHRKTPRKMLVLFQEDVCLEMYVFNSSRSTSNIALAMLVAQCFVRSSAIVAMWPVTPIINYIPPEKSIVASADVIVD